MPRILIVDDDHSFRKMLWLKLVEMGYDVVEAVNGDEAEKLHRHLPADLLMTDLLMPEQEGVETIQEFHRIHPEVKIIGFSGGVRMGKWKFLGMAEMIGASRTLMKPFSIQEISDALHEVMPAY